MRIFANAAFLAVSRLAIAQAPAVEFSFDSPLLSKYVWRGMTVVDSPVWQPSVNAFWSGWNLNVWGNFELGDSADYGPGFGSGRGKFTEVDTTLTYGATTNGLEWSLGFVRYDYPNTGFENTTEAHGSFTLAGEWSPTLTVFSDIDAVGGSYLNLGVSRAWEAGEGDFALSAGLGYGTNAHNGYYFGSDKSGLVDLGAGLTYSYSLSESASLTLYGNYSSLLDKALAGGMRRDNVVFGAGVTVEF